MHSTMRCSLQIHQHADAAAESDLRSKYDVIIFAPVGYSTTQSILDGTPRYGNATPWQTTDLTPNLGRLDSTADTRPGLGLDGLEHLRDFVQKGGLLITCEDTSEFAIESGLAPGVSVAKSDARVVGTVLDSVVVAPEDPIAWGYGASLPVISANGMAFNISNVEGGRGAGRTLMKPLLRSNPQGVELLKTAMWSKVERMSILSPW